MSDVLICEGFNGAVEWTNKVLKIVAALLPVVAAFELFFVVMFMCFILVFN
jgi:hypothetical protein